MEEEEEEEKKLFFTLKDTSDFPFRKKSHHSTRAHVHQVKSTFPPFTFTAFNEMKAEEQEETR